MTVTRLHSLTLQPSQRVLQLEVHAPALTEMAGDDGPVPPVVGHRARVKLSIWATEEHLAEDQYRMWQQHW